MLDITKVIGYNKVCSAARQSNKADQLKEKKMKQLEKFNAKENHLSIDYIARDYKKTKLDGSFQRLGGMEQGSGWNVPEGEEYLANLLEGGTANSVIRADVSECLKYAKELLSQRGDNKKTSENFEYWQDLADEGWEYLSVDGNNTCSAVNAFVNGFTNEKGEHQYLAAYDPKSPDTNYGVKFFLTETSCPDRELLVYDILHQEKIHVFTLRDITYHQVCRLFRNLNKSTHLNPQEHRQAVPSPLSKFIRDASEKKAFRLLLGYGDSKYDKRDHEELVAKFYLRLLGNPPTVGKAKLDSLYEKEWETESKVTTAIKSLVKSLKLLTSSVEASSKKAGKSLPTIKQGQFTVLCGLLLSMSKHNISIKDHSLFFEWFLKQDNNFRSVADKTPGDDHYNTWLRLIKNSTAYYSCILLFEDVLDRETSSLQQDGVIMTSPQRSSADCFSWEQKVKLYGLQEGLDRNGNPIHIFDLYRPGALHADHMVSFKDGGKTTLENSELMLKEDNLKKGASSNEPHFEHQA